MKIKNKENKMPEWALETDDSATWKPCIICGGELIQVRKALFSCLRCSQEIIADEEDMKEAERKGGL